MLNRVHNTESTVMPVMFIHIFSASCLLGTSTVPAENAVW